MNKIVTLLCFAIGASQLLPTDAEAQTKGIGHFLFETTGDACVASTPSPNGLEESMNIFFNRELAQAGRTPVLFFQTNRKLKLPSDSIILGYDDNTIQVAQVFDLAAARNGQVTLDPGDFDSKIVKSFRSKGAVSIATEDDLLFEYFSLKGFSQAYNAVKDCIK